ncbi:hypothetical protein MGG_16122 [Pyricularia oryzae 70-15]|uniref:Uncharacterized protein n=3 Tax=Pyricularia oryzae TaxID=318829 RepID=G4MRG1_PYRO7|nr:uncharacterized protein MGG_16122 [Pyricularia oryzae 70-15]EHA56588.1 hypothetical protein MGG_16122 [Pyricularia oryzae 70-15]ELQ43438.1 hypothetical protein OOU_Y34scaffold00151g6 [Pyricularia oryzae Y34]
MHADMQDFFSLALFSFFFLFFYGLYIQEGPYGAGAGGAAYELWLFGNMAVPSRQDYYAGTGDIRVPIAE